MTLAPRPFGSTGLFVSPLGLGAGHLGDTNLSEREVGTFLNCALDSGICLIDTARGYGRSEERIGRSIGHRRNEFVLSTKVGYGIPGHQDWTYECVKAGVEEALRNLRTDCIDIVHLHSCPVETLQNGGPLQALHEAVNEGKVRVAAYSGENEPLEWVIQHGHVASVQHSVNICDQRCIDGSLSRETDMGLGVIAKRPLANAPWRYEECPKGEYVEEYWWRWKTMKIDRRSCDWDELALRFAAFTPGVSSCIVGTTSLEHLVRNLAAIQKGPLPGDLYQSIRNAFRQNDPGWWRGQL